jgi:hypothetical protein
MIHTVDPRQDCLFDPFQGVISSNSGNGRTVSNRGGSRPWRLLALERHGRGWIQDIS